MTSSKREVRMNRIDENMTINYASRPSMKLASHREI